MLYNHIIEENEQQEHSEILNQTSSPDMRDINRLHVDTYIVIHLDDFN